MTIRGKSRVFGQREKRAVGRRRRYNEATMVLADADTDVKIYSRERWPLKQSKWILIYLRRDELLNLL